MYKDRFLKWNLGDLYKFCKKLKEHNLTDQDIFAALIVYKSFSEEKGINMDESSEKEMTNLLIQLHIITETNYTLDYKTKISNYYKYGNTYNGIRTELTSRGVLYKVDMYDRDILKDKYLNKNYLEFIEKIEPPRIGLRKSLISLEMENLNNKKGLTYNLIPKLIEEANINYEWGYSNSCALILRRICEILIIEILEDYNQSRNTSELIDIKNDQGYFGFGTLINRFKKCNFKHSNRDLEKCLDQVKKYGDIGAHDAIILVKTKHIDDYIKPDIERLIYFLLDLGGFYLNE